MAQMPRLFCNTCKKTTIHTPRESSPAAGGARPSGGSNRRPRDGGWTGRTRIHAFNAGTKPRGPGDGPTAIDGPLPCAPAPKDRGWTTVRISHPLLLTASPERPGD